MLDDLKVLCRSHDWGYEYSDCYRTWDRGSRERAQIHDLITALTVDTVLSVMVLDTLDILTMKQNHA